MPRKSQRKGRRGELEVAALFRAAGFDACSLGIYEALDVRVAIDGRDERLECKRKARCLGDFYKAIKAGAWGLVERADNEQWALTIPLATFFHLAGDRYDCSPDDETKSQRIIRRVLEVISEESREADNKSEVGQDNKRRFADTNIG